MTESSEERGENTVGQKDEWAKRWGKDKWKEPRPVLRLDFLPIHFFAQSYADNNIHPDSPL